MNEADFATESRLRQAAREAQPDATAVLADFYEQRGQLSRAALWRRPERDERTEGERDRTCVKASAYPSPVDPRRDAMIWVLCLVNLPFATIGEAFKLSASRIREVANRVDREIYFAARSERLKSDFVFCRLRAAGAILMRPDKSEQEVLIEQAIGKSDDNYYAWRERQEREYREQILRIEVPPASWPYTRPHEESRRQERGDAR